MGDEKIAHDRSALLTFFPLFLFGNGRRFERMLLEQITVITLFLIVVRKMGWEEKKGGGEKTSKTREIMSANNNPGLEKFNKTRRQY